ncbi:MAG: M4 family metallopeptidase [Gemmatimonadota bacterium]|nr:M4 family metallopeptidase [Gemmatimonadota bacterium]
MPNGFQKISYNVYDMKKEDLREIGTSSPSVRGIGIAAKAEDRLRTFTTDEAAARFYVGRVLDRDQRPTVRGLASPERPEVMPNIRLKGTQQVPNSNDKLVTFDQTASTIPIFGSRVVVQLDEDRELVNVGGDIAVVKDVAPVAALSPAEALDEVAEFTGVSRGTLDKVAPPTLTFFFDEQNQAWHLAYFCEKLPVAPKDFVNAKHSGHGLGLSPRELKPSFNYLVDAHDGKVLFHYSAAPTVNIPSECLGDGELGTGLTFWGRRVSSGFEMIDPRRSIKTYDLAGGDIEVATPLKAAVTNSSNNWTTVNKAAVSAHVNATKVYNFYKSVLFRDSIDDKGMDLVSVVNCTYSSAQDPPEWHNAVWHDHKMWYGQNAGPGETLISYSRFLDVIAHELTHGVTEYTSNLVYKNQSGALNESFSDIFGIIIANWDPTDPDRDVGTWTWQLGAGLGSGGKPLRDLSDPTVTGDPDHMDKYLRTTADEGGVHTNSNIHNKAAYNVLTATDDHGARVFRPMEAAELYYLCLSRLSSVAKFSDALQTLVDVASIYFAGDESKRADRIKHITSAYAKVGIA